MAYAYEVGFIGAGNMAEAIAAAVVRNNLYAPSQVILADPVPERLTLLADRFQFATTDDNKHLLSSARRIVWSVKPQVFEQVAAPLADLLRDDQPLVSIMAGVGTKRIEAAFPAIRARVVRVMPNLPIQVGQGMAGLCAGRHATEQDVADARAIFNAGGATVVVDDESLMDAVTAVSGSGPAYFYYFVEAMVQGGIACGLNEADALTLAKQTCLGAAKMMLATDEPPADLRRKVTSKGGTTQAALEHLADTQVDQAIRDAVRAAYERGRELGS